MEVRRGSFLFCSDGLFSLTGADPFSGFHRFSPFHFLSLSLSGKEISAYGRGGIGSSRRLLFQRSSVPPRSPLHYQLENGGAINLDVSDTSYRDFRQTVEREACTRDPITQSTCMTENKKKNEISQRQVVTYRDIFLQIIIKMSCRVVTFAYQNSI